MDAKAILERIAALMGWSESEQIGVLVQFIQYRHDFGHSADLQDFETWLGEQADLEEADGLDAGRVS